jgi:hypothetical protein
MDATWCNHKVSAPLQTGTFQSVSMSALPWQKYDFKDFHSPDCVLDGEPGFDGGWHADVE